MKNTSTLTTVLLTVALAGCADGYSGQVATDTVLTDEQLLKSIEEEYGEFDEQGRLLGLSGDASLAHSLTSSGHRWTVEDVKRNRPEARRLDRELMLEWTREHLGWLEGLEGPGPPPGSSFLWGSTLAEEVAAAKTQIGNLTNSLEKERQLQLPPAEQLEEARKYLAELNGPSPPSGPYLWGPPWETLEGEIAWVEGMIEGLQRQLMTMKEGSE